ncbi:MAG TPA: TIGR02281 family clan AA aspartic protease [Cellvibrio sp.]|nr:TIGR02281 family clan AA aspartic protease [Cellvibrio sp.]
MHSYLQKLTQHRVGFQACLVVILLLVAQAATAMDIQVRMLARGSALLEIDGKQRMLRDGNKSPEGVLLVSSDGKKAVIEVDGKRQALTLTKRIATNFTTAQKSVVRIASTHGGHYVTPGRINGMPVEFMVDTGATMIAMNYVVAERLGIDYRAGRPIKVNTANGVAQAYEVILSSVSIGDLEVQQIRAAVSTTEFPQVILLGNSYLGKVDMQVDNGVLLLQSRH